MQCWIMIQKNPLEVLKQYLGQILMVGLFYFAPINNEFYNGFDYLNS